MPYTFLFIRRVGVHPLRDPAFPEPVIGLTIDNTKVQKIFNRHNKFPLNYGGITILFNLCLVWELRLSRYNGCLDYSEGHGPAVVSDTP